MKKCENEEKLIAQAVKGNTLAFGELVRHYEQFVFNVAYSFMNNSDDSFDVAQDAFIKAWQKLSGFKGESAFSTWLYRITANTAKDALAQRNKVQCGGELNEQIPSQQEAPEDSVIREENARELRRALDRLDADARQILVLREFEELSYSEISDVLGVEIGTVKSRLNRAREKLRELLTEQNHGFAVKRDENK